MSTVKKKYQVFPGKLDFCCDGRFMISKSRGVFYLTLGLIVITSALFFAFDCRYLTEEFSYGPIFPVVGGILFFFVLSNLLRTSFIDPGIVPRAKPSEAEFIQKQLDDNQSQPGVGRPPRTKDICINGQTVRVKYCYTCKIFRPPRASHCGVCDNCVERFDHHCPWVGNCVGRRNYRYFYLFVLSLSVYCLFVMGASIAHIVQRGLKDNDFLVVIKNSPTSIAVILIAFFSVWSVVGLAGFHTFLILKEQTTNEDIKGTFSSQPPSGSRSANSVPPDFNPYSRRECCGNWSYVLCGPYAPSLIDARGLITIPETTPVDPTVPSVVVVGNQSSGHQPHNQVVTGAPYPRDTYPQANQGANAAFSYSSLSTRQQNVDLQPHSNDNPSNAQDSHSDARQLDDSLYGDNATMTSLCSEVPVSPSKVRPVFLPATHPSSSRQDPNSSSSVAYSQLGYTNGDISPECSVNLSSNFGNSTTRLTNHPV